MRDAGTGSGTPDQVRGDERVGPSARPDLQATGSPPDKNGEDLSRHASSPAGECGITPKGKNNAGGLRPAVGAWTRQAWLACFGGANGWKGHDEPASSALGGQGREAGRARRLPLPLHEVLASGLADPLTVHRSPAASGRQGSEALTASRTRRVLSDWRCYPSIRWRGI